MRGNMTPEARNWLKFVDNRLYPNLSSGEVTYNRAAMVAAIMTGKEINVARIIRGFLQANKKNCGHPALITAIALSAGVPVRGSDDTRIPQKKLEPETFRYISQRNKRLRTDEAEPSGAAQEDPEEAEHEEQEEQPTVTIPGGATSIEERLERLELRVGRMHDEQIQMHEEQLLFQGTITSQLAAISHQLGISSQQATTSGSHRQPSPNPDQPADD